MYAHIGTAVCVRRVRQDAGKSSSRDSLKKKSKAPLPAQQAGTGESLHEMAVDAKTRALQRVVCTSSGGAQQAFEFAFEDEDAKARRPVLRAMRDKATEKFKLLLSGTRMATDHIDYLGAAFPMNPFNTKPPESVSPGGDVPAGEMESCKHSSGRCTMSTGYTGKKGMCRR